MWPFSTSAKPAKTVALPNPDEVFENFPKPGDANLPVALAVGIAPADRKKVATHYAKYKCYFVPSKWQVAKIKPYADANPAWTLLVADTSDLSDELKTAVSNPIGVASINKLNAPKPVAKVAPAKPAIVAKTVPSKEAAKPVAKPVPAKAAAAVKPKVAPSAEAVIAQPKQPSFEAMITELSLAQLPDVFDTTFKVSVDPNKPTFLFLPWIPNHGDKLMGQLQNDTYAINPLAIIVDSHKQANRRAAGRFIRNNPGVFKQLLKQKLMPVKHQIKGMVFSMDWPPIMRLLSEVCHEIGIKRILVPHESVFVDPDQYYKCHVTQADMPNADIVLAWGELQASIFVGRGYPAKRIVKTGAPKFDTYHNYQPQYSYKDFCKVYRFDTSKPTVLFASQPMDSQFDDVKYARQRQNDAFRDTFDLCKRRGWNFLLRMPPSEDNILDDELRYLLSTYPQAFIDQGYSVFSAEESLYHSKYLFSVNSTMLFEALLMQRRPISLKYVEFDQFWQHCGIPAVHHAEALAELVDQWETEQFALDPTKLQWAADNLSCGAFDGQASARIAAILCDIAEGKRKLPLLPNGLKRLKNNDAIPLNVVALPNATEPDNQRYLMPLLNVRHRVCGVPQKPNDVAGLIAVDVFAQWGLTPNEGKARQNVIGRYLGKDSVVLEDALIRSVGTGLSGDAALGVIIDDVSAYYDATVETSLQKRLNSDWQLTDEQQTDAQRLMERIVKHRIAKYNHAKDFTLKTGRPGVPKVLVVDQRFGDQSVTHGLADEQTFSRMLDYALSNYKHHDILVKQHPDALKGGKLAYYSTEVIAPYVTHANVVPIDFDINPYALFDAVEDVLVVTSGMGFEAALAGKNVLTFGAPFYAGHGFTTDKLGDIPHRKRPRTLAEVFYAAYVEHSRYYSPTLERRCSLDEVIDHIVQIRGW
jgi:hypothetical protein